MPHVDAKHHHALSASHSHTGAMRHPNHLAKAAFCIALSVLGLTSLGCASSTTSQQPVYLLATPTGLQPLPGDLIALPHNAAPPPTYAPTSSLSPQYQPSPLYPPYPPHTPHPSYPIASSSLSFGSTGQLPDGFLRRDIRQGGAYMGYDGPTVTYFSIKTDDRQLFYNDMDQSYLNRRAYTLTVGSRSR